MARVYAADNHDWSLRDYEGEADGTGIVHASEIFADTSHTRCGLWGDLRTLYRVQPTAMVTCLMCIRWGGWR